MEVEPGISYDVWQPAHCSINVNVDGVGIGNGNGGVEVQQVEFGFKIVKLLVDNDGLSEVCFELDSVALWPRPWMVSSTSTFPYFFIDAILRQYGIHDDLEIEELINGAFSKITSILNTEENSKLDLLPINLLVLKRGRSTRELYEGEEEQVDNWEHREDDGEEDEDVNWEYWEDRVVEAAMEETALKPVPATKESIDALNKVKVKLGDDIISTDHVSCEEQCMICLEELVPLQQEEEGWMDLASMPCSHVFHEDCIVNWLNISHLCPLCRFPMPTHQST